MVDTMVGLKEKSLVGSMAVKLAVEMVAELGLMKVEHSVVKKAEMLADVMAVLKVEK